MINNRLLARLSPADLAVLMPFIKPVHLLPQSILVDAHSLPAGVYFPNSGCVSINVRFGSGDTVGVGQIGREGAIGCSLALGVNADFNEAFVQVPGSAGLLEAVSIERVLHESPTLKRTLLRYTGALNGQIAQTAACSSRHTLEHRLATWLLIVHDRIDSDVLPITHTLISTTLSVRRSGVTVLLGSFEKAGLIIHTRGQIRILDRSALESIACECYGTIQRIYDHHLPCQALPI